jgi:superfamily I DNA and/or RNA helicase
VVCATNATAGRDALSERRFDTLVIDEATQATEPSCLIPATRADRLVLAGDHRQLPPTVRSESARERLRETLFERLADRYGDRPDVRTTLDTQFRMHETIQAFPDARFYDGVLEPAESVREHTLVARTDADADADGDGGSTPTDGHPDVDPDAIPAGRRRLLAPAEPLTVLNTAAVEAPERQRTGSTSRENPREARVVARLAADLLRAGLDPGALAVISPYDDQLDRIEGELLAALDGHDGGVPDALEVDTVDGFQGREKTAVFVSLVRSNPDGEVGFLDDPRRFNVALTRARRKAVVVGDADTVTTAPTFEAFFAFARERGAVIDLR